MREAEEKAAGTDALWRSTSCLVFAASLLGCILPDYVGSGEGGTSGPGANGPGGSGATGGGGADGGGADGGGADGGGGGCPLEPFATPLGQGDGDVAVQYAVALPHGGVAAIGYYGNSEGTFTVGPFDLAPAGMNDQLHFLAVFDRDGVAQWAKSFDAGSFGAKAIAATSDDGLVLAMSGTGPTTGPTGTPHTLADGAGLLFRLDRDGGLLWVRALDGTGTQGIGGLAVTAADEVVVTGSSEGDFEVDGQPTLSSTDLSPFYVRFSATGEVQSRILWPTAGAGAGRAVVHSDDTTYIAGDFIGTFLPVANEPALSADSNDGFMIALSGDDADRAMSFGSIDRYDSVGHLALIGNEVVVEGGTGPEGGAVFTFAATQESSVSLGLAGRYVGRIPGSFGSGATIQFAESSTDDAVDVTIGSVTRSAGPRTLVTLSVQAPAVATIDLDTFTAPTVFLELGPNGEVTRQRDLQNASLSAVSNACGTFVYGTFDDDLDWYGIDLTTPLGAKTGIVAFHSNIFDEP